MRKIRRKFVEQQESYAPVNRRPLVKENPMKVPKKRGRKKDFMTPSRFYFRRKIEVAMEMADKGYKFTREKLAEFLGMRPGIANSMVMAFPRIADEVKAAAEEQQKKANRIFSRRKTLTYVPILTDEEIINRKFDLGDDLAKHDYAAMPVDEKFGDIVYYFAMIMPDDCMVYDGIRDGDTIIATWNVRPTYGDLVVCYIPEVNVVTVRRYVTTTNPFMHNLYEGGTTNPIIIIDSENLVYGVVVGVNRFYPAGRLPY